MLLAYIVAFALGHGMAVCLFANSLTSTFLAAAFLQVVQKFGYGANFMFCGISTLLYFVLIYKICLNQVKNSRRDRE